MVTKSCLRATRDGFVKTDVITLGKDRHPRDGLIHGETEKFEPPHLKMLDGPNSGLFASDDAPFAGSPFVRGAHSSGSGTEGLECLPQEKKNAH